MENGNKNEQNKNKPENDQTRVYNFKNGAPSIEDLENGEPDFSEYYPDGDAEHMFRDDHDDNFLNENMKRKDKIRKKNARLSKSQIALIAVIFVIYTIVIVSASWLFFYKPSQPNHGEVPFNTDPVETVGGENKPGSENDKETEEVNNDYTANDEVYNILLVGRDDAASLADVTMLINCNIKNSSVTVMQIPRDTLVTDGAEFTNKVNEAYSTLVGKAYRDGEDDSYLAGAQKYAEMFEKSLCIKIHHTVVISLQGLSNIVDALGGVEVYVPAPMYYSDPEQGLYINIGEGLQTLDGYNAECFVRYRSGYLQADLGRVNAQKIFLTAFLSKIKSTFKSVNLSAMNNFANEVMKNISTDLTLSDIIYYAKFALKLDLDSVTMTTMPGNTAGIYYIMNRAGTLDIINKHYNIYKKEISDSIFDRENLFCFTDYDYMSKVYYGDPSVAFDTEYNAGSIDEDSIYIPKVH